MSYNNIIDLAIEDASRAHINKNRKSTDIPYITHLFSVAVTLAKEGCTDEVIAAGILHDTIEDTSITIEEIRKKFGGNIARIVESCTEPDHRTRSWRERKEHTVEYIREAHYDVRLVSCADKLHNIRSIRRDYDNIGDEIWKRFNAGRDDQRWYYTGLARAFCGHPDSKDSPIFERFEKEVKEFFGSAI